MFHPNIDENGVMQLAILRDNWNPTYDMRSLLKEIKKVLKEPNFNPVYCVNTNAKNILLYNENEYFETWKKIHDEPIL